MRLGAPHTLPQARGPHAGRGGPDTPGRASPGYGPRLPGRTRRNVKRVHSCLSTKSNGLGRSPGPSRWSKRFGVTLGPLATLRPRHRLAPRAWRGLQETESRTACRCPSPRLPGAGRSDGGGSLHWDQQAGLPGQVRWAGGAVGLGSNLWALRCRQARPGAVRLPAKGVPHSGSSPPRPGPCTPALCVENAACAGPAAASPRRAGVCGRGVSRSSRGRGDPLPRGPGGVRCT